MNTTPPLLPETTFKPLAASRLEAMIDHALTHPQTGRSSNIIAFQPLQKFAFGSGMAAMAASIMLAFMLTPQGSLSTLTTTNNPTTNIAISSEMSDMLLLESLES